MVKLPERSPTPDLVVTAATAPASSTWGATVPVSWTVTNQGSATALGDWYDYIYASGDDTFDATDTLVSYVETGDQTPLAPGASYTISKNITIPASATGKSYLLFVTDRDRNQGETDETNNIKAIATIGSPDLVVSAATAPTDATWGQTIPVSWTVTNQGSATTLGGWYDYIYASGDDTLDATDTLVTSIEAGGKTPLAPGQSYTISQNITIPTSATGKSYLLFVTDRDRQLFESNETNNVKALAALAAPDLVVSEVIAPPPSAWNQTIPISWTVTNQSERAARQSWYDYIYASSDANLDAKDIVVGKTLISNQTPLAPGASYTLTQNITLPTDATGKPYLLVVADGSNDQLESNESNNVLTTQLGANQWVHIAAVVDASKGMQLYVNGKLRADEATDSRPSAAIVLSASFGSATNTLNGQLDEVRIWNVARTQAEIQANLNQSLTGNESGLVDYWRFDEGSGTTVTDQTTNRNNGTLMGGTTWAGYSAPVGTSSDATGQRRFTYDPTFNQITSTTDELGRQILYDIDPTDGNIRSTTQVVGAVGGTDDVVTRYTYTAHGQIDTITDPLGRITDYDYDTHGNLIRTTFAKGTVDEAVQRFEYDAAGNRTASIDENGNRTQYVYDALNRLVKVIEADPDGSGPLTSPVTTFAYDADGNLIATTDVQNHTTQNEYDALSRRTKTIDAIGGVTSIGYDAKGNPISITNPLGHKTQNKYDSRDRLIESIDPQGGRTGYRYDFDNNLTAVIDPLGNRTSYIYDARNRKIQEIDPLGNTTAYSYNSVNNLLAQTDPNGHLTRFVYDDLNRLIQQTDAKGGVATTSYDAVGNVVAQTDELGRITRYTYDNLNRQTQITDASGGITKFGYDAAGNLLSLTDQLNHTTQYTYDALNRRTKVTDPLGNSTSYAYDGVDNLTAVTDALGRTTQMGYDALNRRTATIDALGNTTTTAYDAFGNAIALTDELGRTTKFTYDGRNLQTAVIDPLGHTTTSQYDAHGNLVAIADALGNTSRYRYDANNRKTAVIDPNGQTTTTSYDAVGNVLTIADPVGNTTSYSYDALDRVVTDTNELGKTRSYQYDAVGNRIAATDRNGRKRTFTYDALDRQTAEKWLDANGNPIRTINYSFDAASQLTAAGDLDSAYAYTYDAAGQLTSVDNTGTKGLPKVVLGYTYDAFGNRLSVTDAITGQLHGTEVYTYDALNRVTRITQSGNSVVNKRVDMVYDAASQMTGLTRYADLAGTQSVANSTYSYDAAGRLTQLTHNRGATTLAALAWVYDVANRITRFTSPDGISNYTYDATDQLTSTDRSFQSDEAYNYDANGNRTNTGYQTGSNNRLLSDGLYNYEYDNEGNRTKRTSIATGEVTEYTWDYRNRLTQVVTKDTAGNVIKSADYTYDVFDRRIAKSVDPDGAGSALATVERYVYDGDNIALVFDGNGTSSHRYLYGSGVDSFLADENASGQVLWALSNNQGTVRDLVDSTGTIQNHITYDSFGQITTQTNTAVDFRFGYTGRELDQETGQYYYRARYYDAGVGRFISEDPIGFTAGDANLYRYVGNSPLNATDPSGNDWTIPMPGGLLNRAAAAGAGLLNRAAATVGAAEIAIPAVVTGGVIVGTQERTADDTAILRNRTRSNTGYNPDLDPNRINRPSNVPQLNIPNHTGHPRAADVETGTRPFPGAGSRQERDTHTLPRSCPADFSPPYFSSSDDEENSTPASTPVGRKGSPFDIEPGINQPRTIGGREYSGHALDQMQGRGLTPSVVENTVQAGQSMPGKRAGTTAHYDSVNNVTVITDTATGRVITAAPGRIKQ